MDKFILVAFCIFIVMVVLRMREQLKNGGKSTISTNDEVSFAKEKRDRRTRRTRIFVFIQLFILIGLVVFMILTFLNDWNHTDDIRIDNLIIRVLIFLLSLYVIYLSIRKLSNKEKNEK